MSNGRDSYLDVDFLAHQQPCGDVVDGDKGDGVERAGGFLGHPRAVAVVDDAVDGDGAAVAVVSEDDGAEEDGEDGAEGVDGQRIHAESL